MIKALPTPPATLAAPDVARIIRSDTTSAMRQGEHALIHAEALFLAIDDCTASDSRKAIYRLDQIRKLARVGRRLAADQGELLGLARKKFEHEHGPLIAAAITGGAQ
nr:hypothetical protein [uncultured Achromobacter sp.]